MMFFQTLVTLCLALSGAWAAPPLNDRQATVENPYLTIPPSRNLIWIPCFADEGPNFFCALLDVPLDYAIPTGRRAYVPFVKFAATTTPYKGVIIGNFGGPGELGVAELIVTAPLGVNIIGTSYDFVSFDPRGTGFSTPLANCSATVASSTAPLTRRFVDKLYGPRFSIKFFENFYQSQKTLGQQCQATIGGDDAVGPHMHSAVVVHDIISFLDAYANSSYSNGAPNPTHLNYWGFSYGTYIGQMFANMYPGRVGRVVLDSVIDAAANLAGFELNPAYADEALSTFFVYCNLAGASRCPFYTGSTSNDILARFEAMVTKLNQTLPNLRGWSNATVIELTLEAFKFYSYSAAYTPVASFPLLAEFFVDVETLLRSPLTMTEYSQLIAQYQINFNLIPPEIPPAIQCTDNNNVLFGKSLASFLPTILAYEAESFILGEDSVTTAIRCAGWSIVGKGVYSGPFGGVTTANPILFVSNTRDPALPLQYGQKATSMYPGSQLLTIDGTGHTSINTYNYCAFGIIGAYFQNGTLPGSQNFCALEYSYTKQPFGVEAKPATLKKRELGPIQTRLKALMRA